MENKGGGSAGRTGCRKQGPGNPWCASLLLMIHVNSCRCGPRYGKTFPASMSRTGPSGRDLRSPRSSRLGIIRIITFIIIICLLSQGLTAPGGVEGVGTNRGQQEADRPRPLHASVGSTEASNGRLARFGVIDRSIGEPPCARRCRRTNGASLSDNP